MKRIPLILRAAALLILLLLFGSCGKVKRVVFQNVNVVPMTAEKVLKNRDVVIRGSTIESILPGGTADVSQADLVIPGEGKYVIPGLADMHVHLYLDPDGSDLPLYIANGVTTIRDCNGRDFMLDFRKDVENGKRVGPGMYITTYTIRGFEDKPWTLVKERYEKGFDAVKFYDFFPSRTSFHRAMEEAKTLNAYTIGHIPYKVGLAGIIEEGMDEVAHVEELAWEFADIDTGLNYKSGDAWLGYIVGNFIQKYANKPMDEVRAILREEAREIAAMLKDRDITVSTTCNYTHMMDEKLFHPDKFIQNPCFKYLPPLYYIDVGLGREKHQQQFKGIEHLLPVWQAMLEELNRALHEQGILIAGGTDAIWYMGLVPGFSLHDELAYFVDIGFSPYQALRLCTVNGGIVVARMDGLQKPESGTVEAGKRADLVLLEENPLENIDAVRNNCGVMADGRWYSSKDCAELLAFDECKHQEYLRLYNACRKLTQNEITPIVQFLKDTPYEEISGAVYKSTSLTTEIIKKLKRIDETVFLKTFFQDVVEANWDNANYLNTISWRLGHDMRIEAIYPDAIRAVKRSLELSESAAVYDTLAWLYALNGEYENAMKAIDNAKELDPQNKSWDQTRDKIMEMKNGNQGI